MITGVVSTTSEDLYGDIVTREALESLSKQLVGLNVFLDHDYNYDKVIFQSYYSLIFNHEYVLCAEDDFEIFQSYYSLIFNISISINPTHNPISILL